MKSIDDRNAKQFVDKPPERIITLEDFAARDEQRNVQRWILSKCDEAIRLKKIRNGWDGKTIEGPLVFAFVDFGRWLGRCPVCGNTYMVSWKTPMLYCWECGNGGTTAAYPVQFPDNREEIEAELLKREVVLSQVARNDAEAALHSHAVIRGLKRNWRPGVTVKDLEDERIKKTELKRGKQ